jgi:hypothetical protein
LDASGDAGLTADEAISFERHDHLMDRGWAHLKVALHVGLGGWTFITASITATVGWLWFLVDVAEWLIGV